MWRETRPVSSTAEPQGERGGAGEGSSTRIAETSDDVQEREDILSPEPEPAAKADEPGGEGKTKDEMEQTGEGQEKPTSPGDPQGHHSIVFLGRDWGRRRGPTAASCVMAPAPIASGRVLCLSLPGAPSMGRTTPPFTPPVRAHLDSLPAAPNQSPRGATVPGVSSRQWTRIGRGTLALAQWRLQC